MQNRTLGNSGTIVSSLALGTMDFGTMDFGTITSEDDSFNVLDAFVEADGTLIDTADVYGGGTSEETLGKWFASRGADTTAPVVLADTSTAS